MMIVLITVTSSVDVLKHIYIIYPLHIRYISIIYTFSSKLFDLLYIFCNKFSSDLFYKTICVERVKKEMYIYNIYNEYIMAR